ncbi:MAG: HAD-IIB family hydrolase [Pseudomonadota bacterium]
MGEARRDAGGADELSASLPPLSARPLVLATDLDGTFLGGSNEDRARLYAWIEARRADVGLIFVTGRDPAFIQELTRDRGSPRPDFVVGDVGTTIASVAEDHLPRPIPELEAEIAAAWRDAGPAVRAALDDAPGLSVQSTDFRYRVSYDMDSSTFDARATRIVEDMGLDVLISDNRFFDVLPRGVSKGPSLRRLLRHLGVEDRYCLAAGDTLNDLSMLALGLPAVAVGGAEPRLLERLDGLDHVYVAGGHGAAGIEEAIRAFGFLEEAT